MTPLRYGRQCLPFYNSGVSGPSPTDLKCFMIETMDTYHILSLLNLSREAASNRNSGTLIDFIFTAVVQCECMSNL